MPFPGSISDSISLCCVQVYHGLAVHHFDQFGRSEPVFQFESVHKYRFFLQKNIYQYSWNAVDRYSWFNFLDLFCKCFDNKYWKTSFEKKKVFFCVGGRIEYGFDQQGSICIVCFIQMVSLLIRSLTACPPPYSSPPPTPTPQHTHTHTHPSLLCLLRTYTYPNA